MSDSGLIWIAVAAEYPVAHAYLEVTVADADLPPGFVTHNAICGAQRPEGPMVSVLWNRCPMCENLSRRP